MHRQLRREYTKHGIWIVHREGDARHTRRKIRMKRLIRYLEMVATLIIGRRRVCEETPTTWRVWYTTHKMYICNSHEWKGQLGCCWLNKCTRMWVWFLRRHERFDRSGEKTQFPMWVSLLPTDFRLAPPSLFFLIKTVSGPRRGLPSSQACMYVFPG